MKPRTKQRWGEGDVFAVYLSDGSSIMGQVLAHEPRAMNSAACAFFDALQDSAAPQGMDEERAFATLLVTRDALDNGNWRVIGKQPILLPRERFPYESLRQNGFIGAKVIGSGIVSSFLHAFKGLAPWDVMADPAYFDGLLISPEKKPTRVLLSRTS